MSEVVLQSCPTGKHAKTLDHLIKMIRSEVSYMGQFLVVWLQLQIEFAPEI